MGGSGENIAVLDTYCKGWMAGDARVVMTTLVRIMDDLRQGGLGFQRCNAIMLVVKHNTYFAGV